ncbi:hypothetical protein SLA2020_257740 [Shorea laevis]
MASKPHYDADTSDITTTPEAEGVKYALGPKAFNIVWGNDQGFWRISTQSGAGSSVLARSNRSVSVEKGKRYQISFKLSMKSDAFGWANSPVFLMAKVGKRGKYIWKRLSQLEQCPREPMDVPDPNSNNSFRIDVPADASDPRLYYGLYEVWSGKWKGGLRIHGATVKEIQAAATR